MSDLRSFPIELKDGQWEFLTRMRTKYDLPDESKVVRCLINYARLQTDREREIFEEIRCLDC